MPNLSMVHWNGNQMCIIDIETTGLDPALHEIIQICILPVDANIRPLDSIMPFYVNIRPEYPERIEYEALQISKLKLYNILNTSFETETVKDMLLDWRDKLKLPLRRGSTYPCQIIPCGHNYVAYDYLFLIKWLGYPLYNDIFFPLARDTMHAALYLNDRAAMHGEKVMFNKVNLTWLCHHFHIERHRSHDALQDCLATAAVYRKLLETGLL